MLVIAQGGARICGTYVYHVYRAIATALNCDGFGASIFKTKAKVSGTGD